MYKEQKKVVGVTQRMKQIVVAAELRKELTQGFEEALEVARFVKLVPVDLKASAYTKKRMIMFWNILHQNFPKNI